MLCIFFKTALDANAKTSVQWRSTFFSRNFSLWSLSQSRLSNIGRLFLSRDVLAYLSFGSFLIISKSDYWLRHVCPSFQLTAWNKSAWYLSISRKTVEKIQVSLKSDKNYGYFTWILIYVFNHISMNSSQNEQFFREICRKHQNTQVVFNNSFLKILLFTR